MKEQTLANANRKKWLDRIGVPDCNSIQCPKLDSVIQAVIPSDAIKADGYLSCLGCMQLPPSWQS